MSEVHRYSVVKMLSAEGNAISYSPHGPEVVMAGAFDALLLQLNASEQAKAEMESTLQYISTSASSRSPSSLRALAKGALDKVRGMSAEPAPVTDKQVAV